MTDEQMDARLRSAGERFRAATAFDDEAPHETPLAPHPVAIAMAPRRGRRWGLIASAAAVAAALVIGGTLAVEGLTDGHNATPTGTATPLEGTVWQLLGYGAERNPDSSATFYIGPDGALVADDDCTVISASANVADSHLSPTDLQVRPRSCVDANAPTFTTGVDILTAQPIYVIDGDQLTVSGGHATMHLKSLPGAVPPTKDVPTLADTEWHLGRAISPNGDVAVGRGEAFTVTDGRLKASDGCNTITADAAQSGTDIDLKNVQNTERGCPAHTVDPVVDRVLSGGPVRQSVQGGVLTLSKKGAGTLVYAWAPADEQATNPSALTGPTWRIAGVAGHPAVGSGTLHITSGGRYVVNDGCSQYGGTADVEHGTIRLRGVPKSPSCPGAAGSQATTIDSYLGAPTLWSVRGGDLVIDGGSAQANSLVFTNGVPAPSDDQIALDATTWQLTGVTAGRAPLALTPKNAAIRLGFVNSGKIDYDDGVNMSEGTVILGATTLHIGRLASTAIGCIRSNGCTQAAVIDDVLSGTPTWSISDDQLTVTKAGAGQLVYQLTSGPTNSSAPPSSTAGTDPSQLIGPTWTLASIEHNSGNSGTSEGGDFGISLAFVLARYTATYPCETSQSAPVEVSDHSITFAPADRQSDGSCPAGAVPSPDAVATVEHALMGSVDWSISAGELTIVSGHTTLMFRS